MNIKKTITTALTATLLVGVLASCSPDQTPDPPIRTDPTSTATGSTPSTPTDVPSTDGTDPGTETPTAPGTPPVETEFSRELNIPGGIHQKYLDEFGENVDWNTLGPAIISTLTTFSSYSQFQEAPFDPASPVADLFLRDSSVLFFDDAYNQFKEALATDTNRVFSLFPHYPANGVIPGTTEALEINGDGLWLVKYGNPQYTGVNTTTPVTGMNFSVDVQTSVPLVGGGEAQVVQTLNLTMLPMGAEWIVGDFSSSEPVTTIV